MKLLRVFLSFFVIVPLVLSEDDAHWQDHTDALVVVFVVVALVCDADDALQLICVLCRFDELVGLLSQSFLILVLSLKEQKKISSKTIGS